MSLTGQLDSAVPEWPPCVRSPEVTKSCSRFSTSPGTSLSRIVAPVHWQFNGRCGRGATPPMGLRRCSSFVALMILLMAHLEILSLDEERPAGLVLPR